MRPLGGSLYATPHTVVFVAEKLFVWGLMTRKFRSPGFVEGLSAKVLSLLIIDLKLSILSVVSLPARFACFVRQRVCGHWQWR
jgi:hypothetical protein